MTNLCDGMDMLTPFFVITIVFSVVPLSAVGAPFQHDKIDCDPTNWPHLITPLSDAASQKSNLSPKEKEERDKTLCKFLRYAYQCVFGINISVDEKFCESTKERESPNESHQKRLYDFILKHLQGIHFSDNSIGY